MDLVSLEYEDEFPVEVVDRRRGSHIFQVIHYQIHLEQLRHQTLFVLVDGEVLGVDEAEHFAVLGLVVDG